MIPRNRAFLVVVSLCGMFSPQKFAWQLSKLPDGQSSIYLGFELSRTWIQERISVDRWEGRFFFPDLTPLILFLGDSMLPEQHFGMHQECGGKNFALYRWKSLLLAEITSESKPR